MLPWLAILAVAAGGWLLREVIRAQTPGTGPVPVAFDREVCRRCRMLISEPGFAAQLRTADGTVHSFDDPGCLLLWRHEHPVRVTELYFHHLEDERWVSGDAAVFVRVAATPMAYGLGVRDSGPGLDAEAALAAVLAGDARRAPPRAEAVRVP
jgi:copper chaperone NosL